MKNTPKTKKATTQPATKTKAAPAAKKAVATKKCATKSAEKQCKCKNGNHEECQCKNNENSQCQCKNDKKNSKCECKQGFCFESLITEIFGQLSDEAVLAALMQDYFYTELLKRNFDENMANTLANKIVVDISSFEANVDIKED